MCETTHVGAGSSFSYRLCSAGQIDRVCAAFVGGELSVTGPAAVIDEWAATDQVGISARVELSEGRALHILIEKDFQCLDRTKHQAGEVLYPHPAAGTQ